MNGAFTLQIKEGKIFVKDKEITLDELKAKIDGRYLLQDRIIQHPKMAELHPSSVNTIRLVTFNNGGNVAPLSSALRIGAKGKCVDIGLRVALL